MSAVANPPPALPELLPPRTVIAARLKHIEAEARHLRSLLRMVRLTRGEAVFELPTPSAGKAVAGAC